MANPTYIGKGTIATGTGTSVMPALPASLVNNDYLFLCVTLEGTGISIDAITGWDIYDSATFRDNSPTDVGVGAIYYREVDGTETTPTVSVSGGTPTQLAAVIYQFRGDGIHLIVEAITTKADGDGGSTLTWDSVTVLGSSRTLVAILAQLDSNDPGTPTGYTNNASDTVDVMAIQVALECSSLEGVSVGSSVTATGGSSNGWITFHIVLFNTTGKVFIVN